MPFISTLHQSTKVRQLDVINNLARVYTMMKKKEIQNQNSHKVTVPFNRFPNLLLKYNRIFFNLLIQTGSNHMSTIFKKFLCLYLKKTKDRIQMNSG